MRTQRPRDSNPVEALKKKNVFWAISQLLKLGFNRDGHMFISFVFPQFLTSCGAVYSVEKKVLELLILKSHYPTENLIE